MDGDLQPEWNLAGADSVYLAMDLSGPFRGSLAVASGALTRSRLAGPRFRRLYPDVYVPAALDVDLELLSQAAAQLIGDDGVLAGYSAAELLDASCGPRDAPAEVTVRRTGARCRGCSCTATCSMPTR